MKKVVTLLLIAVLIMGLAIPVSAAATGEKQGVIKAFNEKSITLGVGGKNYTYTIDSKTVVMRIDQEVDFMDVARKGIKVNFKNSGSKLTYISIPNIGAELQGNAKIAVSDLRINVTDSALAADSYAGLTDSTTNEVTQTTVTKVKETGYITATDYVYDDETNLTLGDLKLDTASVKVTLNGKALKVIDGTKEFDATTVGDEVKLVLTKTLYTMVFEKAITDNAEASLEDIEKILKVSYKKMMYEVATTETNLLPVDVEGLIELNGKETTLARATTMGNYWFVRTNPEGAVIHADAFFRDAEAVITSISKSTIKVNILKNGKVLGSETLTLSPVATIQAANGSVIAAKDLKVNNKVLITTEPAEGYQITFIKKK